jgi:hypothetical protein
MEATRSFGQMHFDAVNLGDQRRNRRLPQLVNEILRHPGGTLPEKLPRLADQEAFYRLCSAPEATHAALLQPHRQKILQKLQTAGPFLLVVHDATELDFSSRTSLRRLGQIGNGHGRGYIVQHSLVVDPRQGAVLGLANQILHTRADAPDQEGVADKRSRDSRESRLWLQGTEGLPARRQIVDVSDRGSDTFEYLEHETHSGRTFVIRATHDRSILAGEDDPGAERALLIDWARRLPALGASQTSVRIPARQREKSSGELPALRMAKLKVSAAPLRVNAPHVHRGEHGDEPLAMWVVRVWEPEPPAGGDALEWLLLTNHPCRTLRAARQVKEWYEWRWVIEEYHKSQKTGCAIEELQFRDESRLEPALAVLSVVALTLLQLRDAARDPAHSARRADGLMDPEAILVLSQWTEGRPCPDWTVQDYALALARLGGYRRRKNCPPGWQVLWRGQTKLELMLDGARAARKLAHLTSRKCAMR